MSLNKSYRATLDSLSENVFEGAYILGPIFFIMGFNNEFVVCWHHIVYNLHEVGGIDRPPSRATHVQARNRETKAKFFDVVLFVVIYRDLATLEVWALISIYDLIFFTIDNLLAEVFERYEHAVIAVPIALGPSVILGVENIVLPLLVGHRSCYWFNDVVLGWLATTNFPRLRLTVVSILRISKNAHRVIDVWLRQRPIIWAYRRVGKTIFHTTRISLLSSAFQDLSVRIWVHFVIYFWLCYSVPYRGISVSRLTIERHCFL